MKADLKLYILSAVIGFITGLVSIVFITIVRFGTGLVWSGGVPEPGEHSWMVPVIMTAFGLLMGLCVKYFGVNKGMGFEAVMEASKPDGTIKPVQIPRVVLNGILGLVSGASIGPEAPLIAAGGFSGSWVAKRLKLEPKQSAAITNVAVGSVLGILLESPVAGPLAVVESGAKLEKPAYLRLILSTMVATGIGLALSLAVLGPLLADLNIIPAYPTFSNVDMVYGFVIGIVAGVVGLGAKKFLFGMIDAGRRFDKWPVLRGGAAGLLMGLVGMALPLVMFSGDKELPQVVERAGEYGAGMLLLLALAKLLSMGLAFGGGYQGGNIFPSWFIGGTLGLVITAIFPVIPVPVAMIACMAALTFVLIPMPVFVIFLLAVISTTLLVPVMAMALAGAGLVVFAAAQQAASPAPPAATQA